MEPYLVCQQQNCWSRHYRFVIALSTGMLVSACEPGEIYSIPVAPAGESNLSSQSYRPIQPARLTILPTSPIFEDLVVRMEEREDDVFANSQEEAESKCCQRAESITQTGETLFLSLGAKQFKGKLYKCKFGSEVKPEQMANATDSQSRSDSSVRLFFTDLEQIGE